jgi:hypothetical protein
MVEILEDRVNPSPLPIPQHYPNIRLAEREDDTIPISFGNTEGYLLNNSVDLVVRGSTPHMGYGITDPVYKQDPSAFQLLYTNFSDLYRGDPRPGPDLLTDFYQYADSHNAGREAAFFHVASKATFSYSPSSDFNQVEWFTRAWTGTPPNNLSEVLGLATSGFNFSNNPNDAIYLGFPDPFREINITLSTPAVGNWNYEVDYYNGGWNNPIATNQPSFSASSVQITFDPPADWKPLSIRGGSPTGNSPPSPDPYLYYVRIVTKQAGMQAPVASKIVGHDYLNRQQPDPNKLTYQYTIPAFDYAADTDNDGYLSDAEWLNVSQPDRLTYSARFVYETRLLGGYDYGNSYGPLRLLTNPADPTFRDWVSDFEQRNLSKNPHASGLFVDNSTGRFPYSSGYNTFTGVLPSEQALIPSYARDYGAALSELAQAVSPLWVVPNTNPTNGTDDLAAEEVVAATQTALREDELYPLQNDWPSFDAKVSQLFQQDAQAGGKVYSLLTTTPTYNGLSLQANPNTALTCLAAYYLLADPATTFLELNNTSETNTSWTRRFVQAAAYDVGQPTGPMSLAASGPDPEDQNQNPPSQYSRIYHIYQRAYQNALVLYRPLSYDATANKDGTPGDDSAVSYPLNGTYYVLQPDGTLLRNSDGSPTAVTSVSLRNGEGAILIKAQRSGAMDIFFGPSDSTPGAIIAPEGGTLGSATWTRVSQDSGTMQVVNGAVQVRDASGNLQSGDTGLFADSIVNNLNIVDLPLLSAQSWVFGVFRLVGQR